MSTTVSLVSSAERCVSHWTTLQLMVAAAARNRLQPPLNMHSITQHMCLQALAARQGAAMLTVKVTNAKLSSCTVMSAYYSTACRFAGARALLACMSTAALSRQRRQMQLAGHLRSSSMQCQPTDTAACIAACRTSSVCAARRAPYGTLWRST